MAINFLNNQIITGDLSVGSNTNGYDVKFFGDASGEFMQWDASAACLTIRHTDEEPGLGIFTNGGAITTQPQLRVGRDNGQYWGVYTGDRDAHLVHRQDETSGIMTTKFDQWDSNTSDTDGYWAWRSGDGSGASMLTALTLTQAGSATFAGNLIVQGTGDSYFVGNVGIGTTSPRGKLDIVGNTDDDTDLTIQDNDPSAGSHRPSIRFRSDTAQIGQILGLDNSMRFSVGTTEDSLLEIASGGNVGIGVTGPNAKLEVSYTNTGIGAIVDITHNYRFILQPQVKTQKFGLEIRQMIM